MYSFFVQILHASNYTENYKKSQTQVGEFGRQIDIDCETIHSVVNEKGDLVKFLFKDGKVFVNEDFKLLTITYSGK